MKLFLKTLFVGVLASFLAQATVADDFAEVREAVGKYFAGTENGRPDLLQEAFLPSLEIQYVNPEGKLGRITAADYISRFKPGTKADRKGRIVHMDVVGTTASVKAEIVMGERLYTDYLLLLKLPEGWRISNKIASYRMR